MPRRAAIAVLGAVVASAALFLAWSVGREAPTGDGTHTRASAGAASPGAVPPDRPDRAPSGPVSSVRPAAGGSAPVPAERSDAAASGPVPADRPDGGPGAAPAPAPAMGASPGPGGPPPASDALPATFAAEQRKEGWAAPREAEIRTIVGDLIDDAAARGSRRVALGRVECRYRICQVPLAASDERALARVVDAMGKGRGFQHRALDLHVTRTPSGMTVFLRFGR